MYIREKIQLERSSFDNCKKNFEVLLNEFSKGYAWIMQRKLNTFLGDEKGDLNKGWIR